MAQGDRRFSHEEKATKRFALQRQKLFESRNRQFNLHPTPTQSSTDNNDNTIKVVDTDESSEDDEEGDEPQGREMSGQEERSGQDKESNKIRRYPALSWPKEAFRLFIDAIYRKEALSNAIATSKKAKAMRHMQKELQMDVTDKLDEIFSMLNGKGALEYSKRLSGPATEQSGDYDSLVGTHSSNIESE